MKNKLCYILLILVVSFSFINNINANEFVISTEVSSKEVISGGQSSILIKLKASEAIKECRFNVENSDTVIFDNISSLVNSWNPSGTIANGYIISNSSQSQDAPDGIGIAELKYTINDSGNVIIKNFQCISMVGDNDYTYDDITVDFAVVEDDTTLGSLMVNNGVMNPSTISGNDIDYIITLNSATFGLSMTASNSDYNDDIVVKDFEGNVISDVSNITFNNQYDNMMPLTVTVNNETTYSLLVTYVQEELDNSLATLTINGEELTLIDGQYYYEYSVSKEVTEFIVAATLKDSENFKFSDSSIAPGTFTINDFTTVLIEIVPKDSSSGTRPQTYIIDVTREGSEDKTDDENDGSGNNTGTGTTGGSMGSGSGNVDDNPKTSDIPMILMAFILVVSLAGSVILYQKNLEGYK